MITLQEKLRKIGYKIVVDGDFGSETETAVMNFQLHNDLTADGIVTEATQKKLDDMIARLEPNKTLTWEQILDKVTDRPVDWKKAINIAMAGASGELEIFKYLPQLIEKVYGKRS